MNKSFFFGFYWIFIFYVGKIDFVDYINIKGLCVLCNLYLYIKLDIGLKED